MIQPRRAIVFLLGIWIGASILADFATLNSFDSVDDFLQTPGSVSASVSLNKMGRENGRQLMRRFAGEANADLLFNWERAGAVMGVTLFFLLLFGRNPNWFTLGGVTAMTAIVLAQHFLTPQMAEMARKLDDLAPTDPTRDDFGILHSTYSILEIVKVMTGLVVAWLLARRENREVSSAAVVGMSRG